jgi:hypothetical protein
MNMEDSDKKRDNLERAKTIMGKIDPALLSAALSEMMVMEEESEDSEVARVKEAIRGIYDSIPEDRDKKTILSKAITELNSDIIGKEVQDIKENLAGIDRQTIIDAAKEYVDIQSLHKYHFCHHAICMSPLGSCVLRLNPCSDYCVVSVKPVFPCNSGIEFCISPVKKIPSCVYYQICNGGCPLFGINSGCTVSISDIPGVSVIDPQIREGIIQEVLQRPELSRAVEKMLKKIQDEK